MIGEKVETGNMSYHRHLADLQGMISEAHSLRLSDKREALNWAEDYINQSETYEEVKDLAHHYGIGSVEVAHHQTIKAQLKKMIAEEILDWKGAEAEDAEEEEAEWEVESTCDDQWEIEYEDEWDEDCDDQWEDDL